MYFTRGLHRALQQHPERIATRCGERAVSFRQQAERVARLAGALRRLGMQRGDRVAILAHTLIATLNINSLCRGAAG